MQDGLYYHYVRTDNGTITFAINIESGWAQFSYALCSPKDTFTRGVGRFIAVSRLFPREKKKKGRIYCLTSLRRVSGFEIQPDAKLSDVFKQVREEFWAGYKAKQNWVIRPSWLKKLYHQFVAGKIEEEFDELRKDVSRAKERPPDTKAASA